VDSAVPSSATLVLAQEVDATATQMSDLATAMIPYGIQGTPR
jgi:hypothetical protein